MKNKKKKLSLNKLRITKITNPHKIIGGELPSSAYCKKDSSVACIDTSGGGTASNANNTYPPPTKPLNLDNLPF